MIRAALLASVLLAGISALAVAKPRTKPGPDVLVVADLAADAAVELQPAPQRPVHYVIIGQSEYTLGASVAGEPEPDPAALEREVVKALASQGYVRTQIGGPIPSLAIVITWGSANLMVHEFDETDPETGETSFSSFTFNHREIAQLVGADKANRHLLSWSEADAINDAARQDRLYIMIAALDIAALREQKKKLVWRTRISIESLRNSLPAALPVMLASAAPFFGRGIDRPVFVDDDVRRKVDVQIGTPVVVPDPAPAVPENK